MQNKKGEGKLSMELILGLVVLAFGALLLADLYAIFPAEKLIPKEIILYGAGFGCVIGGIMLIFRSFKKGI